MSYRLQFCLIIACAAFACGFFYGQATGKKHNLQQAIAAFAAREEINHAVDKVDAVDLCLALGGVRETCRSALRRVGEAAKSE